MGMDKLMHFGVCFLASMVLAFAFPETPLVSIGFTCGLGLGKEYGDSKAIGNEFSYGDLLADGAGIACGVLAGLFLRNAWDNIK